MEKQNRRFRSSVVWFIVWIASYTILGAVLGGINFYQIRYQVPTVGFLRMNHAFYYYVLTLPGFFLPLMGYIHKRSGREGVKWLRIVSKILMIYLTVFLLVTVILTAVWIVCGT